MNITGEVTPLRGNGNVTGQAATRSATHATVVALDGASRSRQASCDLYLECCRSILGEHMSVHALVMPDMDGQTLPMKADEDLDLRDAVEHLTGNVVRRGDLVVLLGTGLLDDQSVTRESMMMIAANDIALHIDALYPTADLTVGWFGKHLGTASVAATIIGAMDFLREVRPEGAAMAAVKKMARDNIKRGMAARTRDDREAGLQAVPAMNAVEAVCWRSTETHGYYLTLPAAPQDIANAAKVLLLDAIDELGASPKPFV